MAAVDARGRIADRVVPQALGWPPGTRVAGTETDGVISLYADDGGGLTVNDRGHLRLPASQRRACGIRAGDRVLLAVELLRGRVLIHPPAVLDSLLWGDVA
jgi:hypothetical protein